MIRSISIVLLFSLVVSLPALGQEDRKKLEKQRSVLEKKIKYTEELINETKTNKEQSQTELVMLNKKISLREELISNIGYSIDKLQQQIADNYAIIGSMEKDLEELKVEYAKMIQYAYRNRSSYDKMMFIFSAESFDQAYKRLKYFQQYSDYRKRQALLIVKTQSVLNEKTTMLERQKLEKESLLVNRQSEKSKLSGDIQKQQNTYVSLKKREKELAQKYQKYKKDRDKLNLAIEKAIAAEIAAETKKPHAGAGASKFELTPAEKALAASFETNKGKLPWPVERGQKYRSYGKHPHAFLPNVVEENKGIDILTNRGSHVLAVFDGVVSTVMLIPGQGQAVMVKHGNYRSVYTNLKEVYVKKGDNISTRQSIGALLTDETNGRTEAHLEIWKITGSSPTTVDPATWLQPQR